MSTPAPSPPTAPSLLSVGDIMTRDIQTLDHAATLDQVAQAMVQANVSSVVLTDKGIPVGILTERDMLRLLSVDQPGDSLAHTVMSRPLRSVAQHMPFESAWAQMTIEGLRHLLVIDAEGVLVGVVSETDFARRLDATTLHRLGHLDNVLRRDLPTLPPQATLAMALEAMQTHPDRCVVVAEDGRPLGMLTEHDMAPLMLRHPRPQLMAMRLADLALARVHAIGQRAWLTEAVQAMHTHGTKHLAVLDDQGHLVGMLLSHELMAALGRQLWHIQLQAQSQELNRRARMAEERLHLAASAARLGFWDFDAVLQQIDYSPHMVKLMGGQGNSFVRSLAEFASMVHADQQEAVRQHVARALDPAGDGQLDMEYQVRGIDGQWRWVHTRGEVVERAPDGRVLRVVGVTMDIQQRKAAEMEVHRLAYFDPLTGLPNRQLLADRFGQALSMAKRQGMSLALMFIDLDHFKHVNDTLGHAAGDQLLVQTSQRLSRVLREADTLSRQGGDEFIVLLPQCSPAQAAQVAEKLLASQAQPVHIDGHEVVVTLSIGIALYPNDGSDYTSLSKAADVAMYRAKDEGRNGYRFFTPEMQTRSSRTLMLESDVRRALDKNQLQLVYQPQVSLADGRVLGVEALLRWHHPTLGCVSPMEFIPMAESNGAILPMGEWVLRTAVQQAKAWMDRGLGKLVVAVNLSAVQFRRADLAQWVGEVLDEHQLPPDCLELELTESVAMSDPLAAAVAIDEINALGVSVAIDDFGTGYSSLSYLKRFKVRKLKIDKSFVQDITTDPEDKAIASAIIGLASSLGLRTVAEGVETPGQLAWLRMQGCDEAQGYLFAQPLEAAAVAAWMQRPNPLLNG